jgi:transcriptional regulator GlxA family with amidase domain
MQTIGIAVYQAVNEMEVLTIFDLLSSVKSIENGHQTNSCAFSVKLLGASSEPIGSAHDFTICPHIGFDDAPNLDAIVIPGGPGARLRKYPEKLPLWLSKTIPKTKHILCLSTGSFILARAGFLKGRRVAVFPQFAAEISQIEPTAKVVTHERTVLDGGNLISTTGMSCCVDAAVAYIERVEGIQAAELALRRIAWPVHIDEIAPLYSA